jgi:hypothetical protein
VDEGKKEHENLIPLHNKLLQQNAEDIKELKELTFGLPQTLERIEYVVTKLGENFDKFLDSAEKKFQTKEMCELCREGQAKDVTEVNKRIDNLEKKWNWLINGMLVIGLAVITFSIKYGVSVITEILSNYHITL